MEGGRAVGLYILLQDNDMRLTLPRLVFPPAASCGIVYQWEKRQMGLVEEVWAWVGEF